MDPMPPSNLPAMSSPELFGVGLRRYLAGILRRYLALTHA